MNKTNKENVRLAAIEILKESRGLLATPGFWTQDEDELCEPDKFCLFTATGNGMSSVDRERFSFDERQYGMNLADRAVRDVVLKRGAENVGVTVDTIANWNDAPGRTLDEVLSVVDEAINELQQTT